MKKTPDQPADAPRAGDPPGRSAAELRRRAEEQLKRQRPAGREQRTAADRARLVHELEVHQTRLVHELEVHQIELEMQNEELQQARDELEAALGKYTDLYDFAPMGYLILDREGAVREANLAGARLLGVERSALVNRRFGPFVSPADRPVFSAFLQKVFASQVREACELTLLRDGQRPLEVRLEAAVSESGLQCRAVLDDITERKRAVRALQESEAHYRAVTRSAVDAIVTANGAGTIVGWNPGAERMFGYPEAEALGQPLTVLVPPRFQDRHLEGMKRVQAGGEPHLIGKTLELAGLRKDGSEFPLELSLAEWGIPAGRFYTGIIRDITERQRAEADRLILNKLESTGILAGGIAHDFNNLLTVIVLNLGLAQKLIPAGEKLMSHLAEARQAALAARGLTQQLLTFAQGGAPVRKPTRLTRGIQESVHAALSGSQVRCEFALAEDLWPAEVDAEQVGQVIRNLVLNAKEAMPQGGVVSVRAENVVLRSQDKPALPPGQYVRVSIADRGSGIAKDVLPKIFDPYFSTKQRGDQKGMGLGLTICHAIIQKHAGAITVESEVGVGTTFHLYLPAAGKLSGEEKPAVPQALPRHGRILVMDDEESVRGVVGEALQQMGHEVELAKDGQMAVAAYERAQGQGRAFDMVMLDLTIRGGMGGQEAIRALLRLDPTVQAVVMSGYARDPVLLNYERHGFKAAVMKPFGFEELQETVARLLGSGPSRQAAP